MQERKVIAHFWLTWWIHRRDTIIWSKSSLPGRLDTVESIWPALTTCFKVIGRPLSLPCGALGNCVTQAIGTLEDYIV